MERPMICDFSRQLLDENDGEEALGEIKKAGHYTGLFLTDPREHVGQQQD
jgi:hypothetical protein